MSIMQKLNAIERKVDGRKPEVSNLKMGNSALTLAAAATTIAVTSALMTITGDAGANTVATITGAKSGNILTLIFVDGNVTITNTDAHTANTVDLSAAFTGADDTVLQLIFDGTSWYEIARSTN